jgi:hypothetical protein
LSNDPISGLPAPIVSFVSGEPATDGSSVLLRIETDDGGTRDFALPTSDVDDFVGLLWTSPRKPVRNGKRQSRMTRSQAARRFRCAPSR